MSFVLCAKRIISVVVIAALLTNTLGAWVHQASVGVAVACAGSATYYANEWRQAKKELKALEVAEKLHGQKSPKGIVLRKLLAARKKCAISSLVALVAALVAYRSRGVQEVPSADASSVVGQPVEALIAAKATANVTDNCGATALMWAAMRGDVEAVEALIKAGADVNAQNKFGDTVLIWAIKGGHTEIVDALIKADVDVVAKNNEGATALMIAAGNGQTAAIEALIKAGTDVNATSNNGWTALVWATKRGHTEIATLLEAAQKKKSVRSEEVVDPEALGEDG
ncbi:MAG: ankyrin repeat-rich rane spanning protein [Candidatus Dependentiae bacterium]|nr:ankyrin repeat-rich rane spanning protein [Candidatus Dependentiae bacterium]